MTESTQKKILQLFHLTSHRGREIQKKNEREREREREVGLVCLVDWWTYRAVRVISCLCYINFYSSLSYYCHWQCQNGSPTYPVRSHGRHHPLNLSLSLSLSFQSFSLHGPYYNYSIIIFTSWMAVKARDFSLLPPRLFHT